MVFLEHGAVRRVAHSRFRRPSSRWGIQYRKRVVQSVVAPISWHDSQDRLYPARVNLENNHRRTQNLRQTVSLLNPERRPWFSATRCSALRITVLTHTITQQEERQPLGGKPRAATSDGQWKERHKFQTRDNRADISTVTNFLVKLVIVQR